MVEDEGHVGRAFGKDLAKRQLIGPHAQVKAQIIIGQMADVLDEQVGLAEIIGRLMQNPAHAGDVRMLADLLDMIDKVHFFRATRGDGADNARQGHDIFALGHHVGFGGIDFHVQGRFNAQRQRLGEVVIDRPGPVDGRFAAQPGIGKTVGVNQMEVGIENAHESSWAP